MDRPQESRQLIVNAEHVFSALDSPQRLHILTLLRQRDHVVHELVSALVSALGVSQPLVSQHLRVLKRSGLVTSARAGREAIYHLAFPEVGALIDAASSLGDLILSGQTPPAESSPSATVTPITKHTTAIGKAAITGRMGNPEMDMPGLVPSMPSPSKPGSQ